MELSMDDLPPICEEAEREEPMIAPIAIRSRNLPGDFSGSTLSRVTSSSGILRAGGSARRPGSGSFRVAIFQSATEIPEPPAARRPPPSRSPDHPRGPAAAASEPPARAGL